jgi:hypothetical protein
MGINVEEKTMKCPYCAEQIKDEAIKCPFCKEFLDKNNRKPSKSDDRFLRGKQTPYGYMKPAGWACIISAVTTLPLFIISFAATSEGRPVSSILDFISLGLFIYIFYSLKRLLNEMFNFHLVDTYIMVMICGTVVFSIANQLDTPSPILATIFLIALGIVMIAFAIALMKLEDQLGGLLKPLCYLYIFQGVCMASIILIPLGLLVSIAADVLLALIFFRTADRISANINLEK